MPTNIWDVEWYNQNAQRNYPLVDEATRLDTSGGFTLPNDFIVDCKLVVHATGLDPAGFYISTVSAFSHGYVLNIMYSTEIVASISILSATHTLNKSYSFSGSSDSDLFFDAVGTLVIGSLDTISQFGGSYNFELAATRLNPTIVVQDIRAVSGIRIRHATGDPSDLIQGDVILQEGSNIQLYVDNNTIYISATGNDDYTGVCECSLQQSLTPIRTINGVSPNGSGNIQLTSDSSCLVISPNTGTNSIELQDSCSEPCCGCEELVTLTREIETLRLQLANLERYSDSLDQTIRQLEVTLAITGIGGDIQ